MFDQFYSEVYISFFKSQANRQTHISDDDSEAQISYDDQADDQGKSLQISFTFCCINIPETF